MKKRSINEGRTKRKKKRKRRKRNRKDRVIKNR